MTASPGGLAAAAQARRVAALRLYLGFYCSGAPPGRLEAGIVAGETCGTTLAVTDVNRPTPICVIKDGSQSPRGSSAAEGGPVSTAGAATGSSFR
jgi:hypothetical protein